MNTQEDLDRLIEQYISGEKLLAPSDETVAAMLITARMLTRLQEIAVPPEFARQLEISLRAHIRHLNRQENRQAFPQENS